MGYSCRQDADDTYRQWAEYCKLDTGSSNAYTYNGKKYYLEKGREQRDGAITGTVLRCEPKDGQNYAYPCGSFRINPDGDVARFPVGLKKLLGVTV